MIVVSCDSCGESIDRDVGRWFGLDVTEPPPPIDDDEAEGMLLTSLRINGDHQHHFCSPLCLSSWAFGRTLTDEPTKENQ